MSNVDDPMSPAGPSRRFLHCQFVPVPCGRYDALDVPLNPLAHDVRAPDRAVGVSAVPASTEARIDVTSDAESRAVGPHGPTRDMRADIINAAVELFTSVDGVST